MKKSFYIGIIVGCKNAIMNFSETQGLSGKTTIARRKLLKPFIEEIDAVEDLKNDKIKELGKDDGSGSITIKPGTKEYDEIFNFINQISSVEVEIEVGTPINVDELQNATKCNLTNIEISTLIELGILTEEKEEVKVSRKEILKDKILSVKPTEEVIVEEIIAAPVEEITTDNIKE